MVFRCYDRNVSRWLRPESPVGRGGGLWVMKTSLLSGESIKLFANSVIREVRDHPYFVLQVRIQSRRLEPTKVSQFFIHMSHVKCSCPPLVETVFSFLSFLSNVTCQMLHFQHPPFFVRQFSYFLHLLYFALFRLRQ